MLGINPPTASLLLDEASHLKPGDWVAQNAANSGVGRSLIGMREHCLLVVGARGPLSPLGGVL
jgi:NADPH:quinone reductase-like Zn-dependent oxidoreductase